MRYVIIAAAAAAVVLIAFFTVRRIIIKNVFLGPGKRDMWNEGDRYEAEFVPGAIIKGKSNYQPYERDIYEGRRWIHRQNPERVYITSDDGLKLAGHFIENKEQRAIALAVHGYRSSALNDFSCSSKYVYERGCSLLMIDMRAHGESEGEIITFGVMERYDVKRWCEYIAARFPGVPVLLMGVSMGASTVMMASGLELPACVRGIIADCGFTSPRAIYESVMSRCGRLTPVLIRIAESMTRRSVGFGFDDADTRAELKKNRLPITIVHGTGDTFVPCSMSYENYEAAKQSGADCRLFTAENAEHALSFLTDKEGYLAELDTMIDKCVAAGRNGQI